MQRYGVKLTSGRIVWILAEEAECSDGAIRFYRTVDGRRELIAGFNLAQVNHFGIPTAFAPDESRSADPAS